MSSIALDGLKEDNYRLGDLQVLRYEKNNRAQFQDGYLGHIYRLCQESKITDSLFGGNPASDFDSIVSYLANRPVIVMGIWKENKFVESGFAFPTVTVGSANSEKAMIAGYGYLRHSWGTEDQKVLTILGLAYLFNEFNLMQIIGNRYRDNVLTAKFMEQFGFRDCGEIPRFQLRGNKLVSMVVSALSREDFERYVEDWMVSELRADPIPVIGSEQHPAVEESRETIDAQVARLALRQIPVVFFPQSSTYVPATPDGIQFQFVSSGNPGAGIYFYDPERISAEEIITAAMDGTHGELLGHVQNKMKIAHAGPTVVVQAVVYGAVIQDSVVSRDAESIALQIEAFRRKYPDCECLVKDPMEVLAARMVLIPPPGPTVDSIPAPKMEVDLEAQLPLSWL